MISIDEIVEIEKALHHDAVKNGIEFDAVRVFTALDEQYKILHGSNKQYIGTDQYEPKQDEKIDCCLNRLNSAYEVIKDYYLTNEVNE